MTKEQLNPIVARLLYQLALSKEAATAAVVRGTGQRITCFARVEPCVLPLLKPEAAAVGLSFVPLGFEYDEEDDDAVAWLTAAGTVAWKRGGEYVEEDFDIQNFTDKMESKVTALMGKVAERKARVRKLRDENGITDLMLVELYRIAAKRGAESGSYAVSNVRVLVDRDGNEHREVEEKYVPVSVVSALQAEEENIENENAQIARLHMLLRNIDRGVMHTVSYFDLEYLGF